MQLYVAQVCDELNDDDDDDVNRFIITTVTYAVKAMISWLLQNNYTP